MSTYKKNKAQQNKHKTSEIQFVHLQNNTKYSLDVRRKSFKTRQRMTNTKFRTVLTCDSEEQ